MDAEKKKEIIDNLTTFSKAKDYYAEIGKAWKRGYLLYGPPVTGKSTMIVAIANFLEKKNKEKEEEKEIEDTKAKEESSYGSSKVTLSGLLNFIDGLWSACAEEPIIIFTTNYVEKLDPALIRRGRMDKHIEMSYCGFGAFKVLAKNYLHLDPCLKLLEDCWMRSKWLLDEFDAKIY
ncbi:hypothetical protein IFM89_013374 [Coptis chinensis]|uniref:ATPase AAA-type core domain-containing protein n=1 Tax=Coptis chinensis TaxID=261450 RepID=A0A835HZT4_9MAGN|nr:hypothetical protein IFM89_013374 [Coptis chinensis]